jgi:aminoglycoside phosphotransferase (APT) family kinase protein
VQKADVTADVFACLISEQFPQWADLAIRPVRLDGWDNTTFRLGEKLSVRLPSGTAYVPQIDKEHRWLPVLARHLPFPIPQPIAKGAPGCGFPLPWSMYGWLDGEPAALVGVSDHDQLADDLATFIRALQHASTENGPPAGVHSFNRGGLVPVWDEQTRTTIDQLTGEIDVDGAVAVWEAAMEARWNGPDVWVHGDVTGSNLLMRDDRLCASSISGARQLAIPPATSPRRGRCSREAAARRSSTRWAATRNPLRVLAAGLSGRRSSKSRVGLATTQAAQDVGSAGGGTHSRSSTT